MTIGRVPTDFIKHASFQRDRRSYLLIGQQLLTDERPPSRWKR